MNNLGDILHFMSKSVNFVNSYLKEYLQRSFIAVFWKDQLQEYVIKKGDFYLKNSRWPCPHLGDATQD